MNKYIFVPLRCKNLFPGQAFFVGSSGRQPVWLRLRRFILLTILLLFMGCENIDQDMYNTPAFKAQEFPRKYNPKGSIPFYGKQQSFDQIDGVTLAASDDFYDPKAPKRGEKLFNIFCSVCHGTDAKGRTPVAEKLDKRPADLNKASVRILTEGELFVRALTEDTSMPGHRNELTDKEAWEIVAHIRVLQEKEKK